MTSTCSVLKQNNIMSSLLVTPNHYDVLEKIYSNWNDIYKIGSANYLFSSVIYEAWNFGNGCEQKFAYDMYERWLRYFTDECKSEFHKHIENRTTTLTYSKYSEIWKQSKKKDYKDHKGITLAIQNIPNTYEIS